MATAPQVQALYLAYFGRPGDPTGLEYWTVVNKNSTQAQISDAFAATPEYKASVAGKSNTQIVTDYYLRLFNRVPDVAGLNYWVLQLNSGALTTQNVGLALVTAAQSQTDTPDSIAVKSKLAGADLFTAEVAKTSAGILAYSGVNGLIVGVEYLAPIVNPATVPSAAQTAVVIVGLIASNGGGATDTLALSVFQDVFTTTTGVRIIGGTAEQVPFRFTGSNQVVNAAAGTVTNAGVGTSDLLADPSTNDNDTINVGSSNYAGAFSAGTNVKFSNIETINFAFSNEAPLAFDFSAGGVATFATGAKTINAAGTLSAFSGFNNFGDSGATKFNGSALTATGANGVFVSSYFAVAATNPNVEIIGGAADDVLFAGGGNDTVDGQGGADVIFGNGGADLLKGGAGADNVFGGEGSDTLNGGAGADNLTGGNGKDTFVYDSLEADFVGANADFITDFTQGTGVDRDVLSLSASAFAGLTAGSTFTFTTVAGAANLATNVLVDTGVNIALATGVNALSNTRLAYNTTANTWIYDANGDWATGTKIFANSGLPLTVGGLNAQNVAVF